MFYGIKAGDMLVVLNNVSDFQIKKVSSVTPRYIKIGSTRYSTTTGKEYGHMFRRVSLPTYDDVLSAYKKLPQTSKVYHKNVQSFYDMWLKLKPYIGEYKMLHLLSVLLLGLDLNKNYSFRLKAQFTSESPNELMTKLPLVLPKSTLTLKPVERGMYLLSVVNVPLDRPCESFDVSFYSSSALLSDPKHNSYIDSALASLSSTGFLTLDLYEESRKPIKDLAKSWLDLTPHYLLDAELVATLMEIQNV